MKNQLRKVLNFLISTNNSNKNNRNRRQRRRNGGRFNSNITKQERRNPQHYGVGRTFATIDETLYVNAENGIGARNIINIAVTSNEFARYKLDYQYFKILNIKITIAASIIESAPNGYNYIKMNWDSAEVSEEPELAKDDNAKIFPNYRTKNYVFTFVPPNAVINFDSYAYNYYDFMLTRDSNNLRSTLWYTRSTNYQMKISINMLFVGAQNKSAATYVTQLFKNLSLKDKSRVKLAIVKDEIIEDNDEDVKEVKKKIINKEEEEN